ncbi:hypothetical protein [Francisella frigiditurris]|uniref:Putative lipoprotein n=1 Tax=Francisella frigiditurris TaxID=1542390 RepID=A0A1J0KRR4_9GAMM|nr:hypothetical protein [Francisella frigiditurris]APC96453.1 putative lipoprotein [Francisella frigiditurris]
MKRFLTISLITIMFLTVTSCASDIDSKIVQLQQTQQNMNDKASQDLDDAKNLEAKASKLRNTADRKQAQVDAIDARVRDLLKAYRELEDQTSDDAINFRERIIDEAQSAIKLQKEVNSYKDQADEANKKANDLKATANTEAKEAQKVGDQIKNLELSKKN